MKKACVIGWPISHSRSPLIHNHWLRAHGIAGLYERVPVEPERLRDFLAGLKNDYAGCNVTLPHKEAAFALVDEKDEIARRIGVVNTIYVRDGRLRGTSTDGEGFIANLASGSPALRLKDERAVLLGAGGAAMAIIGALLDQGVAEIAIANRTMERAQALAQKFGRAITPVAWDSRAAALADCALLVNTSSLGMSGQPALEIDLSRLPARATVTDIVYTPLETPLLQAARARGNPAVGGLGMLLHQAVRGFELWFGVRPQVSQALHDLVARDIAA